MFPRRRIDPFAAMQVARTRVFVRHTDGRLLIVSYAADRTLITALDGQDSTTAIATFSGRLAFDGSGWDMRELAHILDECIGRICMVCGTRIESHRLYCSDGCKQSAYRARNGK